MPTSLKDWVLGSWMHVGLGFMLVMAPWSDFKEDFSFSIHPSPPSEDAESESDREQSREVRERSEK